MIDEESGKLSSNTAMPKSLLALLANVEPIEEDFAPIDDLPADPVDL